MSNKNFSRRNFIGLTGLAGAGLALSGNPLMAAQPLHVEMQTSKKFKMGLIGCGNRCRQLVDLLNNVSEIEMTAFCDVLPHKMKLRADQVKTGVKPKLVEKVEDMLKMPELDGIAVFTANDSHRDITIAALMIRYGLPPGVPTQNVKPEDEDIPLKSFPGGDAEAEQFRHFAKAMDGQEKPYPNAYMGRQCVQILEGSLWAAKENRVIDIRELG